MKKLLILLLALLAIAAIAYFCVYNTQLPAIQADIQSRAQSALSSNGLSSINVQVDGRDITLTGVVDSKEMKQQAEELASVNGYHLINNKISVPGEENSVVDGEATPPRNHSLGMSLSDNGEKLTIDGILDANTHKVLKEEAIKSYGEENVTDRVLELDLPIAKGMPEVAVSMLGSLKGIDSGEAVIIGNKVNIKGSVPADKIPDLEKQLKELTPDGYELSLDINPGNPDTGASGKAATPPDEGLAQQDAGSGSPADKATGVSDAPKAKPQLAQNSQATSQPKLQEIARNKPEKQTKSATKQTKPATAADLKRCQRQFNRVLRKSKVRFNSSSSTVKKASLKTLNRLASIAKKCSGMKIIIHGHTDSTGRNKLNKALSKKRARKVATYLANRGVPAKQLVAVGHGSSKPIASNKNEKGRARNRRIEFTVESIK